MKDSVLKFIESEYDEADYFDLSKEDLISLKDYLSILKEKSEKFKNLVKEPTCLIKEKCSWVRDMGYSSLQNPLLKNNNQTGIYLFAVDNIDLIALSDETGKYEEISKQIPMLYLIRNKSRLVARRQNDLNLIQDELRDIDLIGKSIFDKDDYDKESISGHFVLSYMPNIDLSLWSYNDLIIDFKERQMNLYNKPYLYSENKNKVLNRIQFKK